MKKKFLSWILAITSMLSCVGSFSACTEPGEQSSNSGSSSNNSPVANSSSSSSSDNNSNVSDGELEESGSSGSRLPGNKLQNSSGLINGINSVGRNQGVYEGTHINNTTGNTSYNLFNKTATDYILVVPESYTATEKIAIDEFRELFKQATGVTITAKKESASTSYQNASKGKYISLGRTKILSKSGIDASKETLSNDGHIIKTIGDDVYLCGGADEGTVFAVYTFMRLTFNYETYYYDCMEIDNVKNTTVKLKNYDVKEIPDFKYRAHSSDVTTYASEDYNESMFAWRLNYYGVAGNRGYYFMPIHEEWDTSTGNPATGSKSSGSTNVRRWFPERLYNDPIGNPDQYHPKWFSTMGGAQVCFSAHGDPEEYEAMVNAAFEKVKAQLKYYTPTRDSGKYKNKNIMSLTHEDNRNYCRCWKCREISEANRDSQAAVQILFMNDLAAKVDEYMAANTSESWYREDLKLMMFAYNHNMDAPAKYDAEQQKYVATDESMYVSDRVIVWFARDANSQEKFDSTRNGEMITNLDCWEALANNIYFWNYGTNFANYMMPLDSFEFSTPEMFAYFCNKSDKFWFTQLQDNNPNTNSAWHNLKAYLEAKLAWDTSLDMDDLIENWFRAMYKEGAETMLALFKDVRTYQHEELVVKLGLCAYGDGSPDVVKAEYWPMDMVQGWLSRMDTAKGMATDTKTKLHIEAEALSNLYILVTLHSGSLTSSQISTYKNRLTTANTDLNLSTMRIMDAKGNRMLYPDWLATL